MLLRLTLLLSLLAISFANAQSPLLQHRRKAFRATAALAAFSDDFNRADSTSLGANWTEAQGDSAISSNQMGGNVSAGVSTAIYSLTACSTIQQYVKFTVNANTSTGGNGPTAILRYTNSSSPFYWVEYDVDLDQVYWFRVSAIAGTYTAVQSAVALAMTDGDTLGTTITGTGTSTVIRCWVNPTGLPTSTTNWNGDTTPDATLTNDPASPVDTGNYVGLAGYTDTPLRWRFDNFFGGDAP